MGTELLPCTSDRPLRGYEEHVAGLRTKAVKVSVGTASTAPAKPVVSDNPQSSSAHSTNWALVHYKAFNLALPSASQSDLGQDSRRGSLPLTSSPSSHRSHSCLRTQCAVSTRGSQAGQGSRAEDGLVKSCLRVEAGVGWGSVTRPLQNG